MNLLKTVLENGRLCGIDACYQTVPDNLPVGKIFDPSSESRRYLAEQLERMPKWNCGCEKWPANNNAANYLECARTLYQSVRNGKLQEHVVVSELQKAVDCRITELLYFGTLFPTRCWMETKPTFSDKLGYAKNILPECLFPKELIYGRSEERR
ncbi:MAG: hypothetical protein PHD86_03500, partial [Kiritimatiellae bacterium]|nr:hypothetical protein [Kiritimatiellia bacterium]